MAKAFRRWGYAQAFRRTDAVWTLSAEEAAEMRAAFPGFAALFHPVINPYVTPEMLRPPRALARRPAGRTVVTVARLTAQKRLERLISAFARLERPDVRLRILGEGEARPRLQALIDRSGLSERAVLAGYRPDVAAELHAADLFVLPSDYEGLPAAVLEAMAADCPVLSTPCFPSARSLVGGAEGCAIIERADPDSLAAQMAERLDAPRPVGLHSVAERYSVASGVASHLEALQLSLASAPTAARARAVGAMG